jgi:cell division protein FtsX
MNDTETGATVVCIIATAFLPLFYYLGFTMGQDNVRDYNKQVMTEVLAKGCINQPKDCKSYSHYYTAVENFKK